MSGRSASPISHRLSSLRALAVLCGTGLLIWVGTLRQAFALALNDERYTHLLLILPLAFLLMAVQWKPNQPSRRGSNWGLALLALSLGVLLISRLMVPKSYDLQLAAAVSAFVIWCLASFIWCFGLSAFRERLFPLLFLFWLVPLPTVIVDTLVGGLQRSSASSAELLFRAVGTPVSLNNLVLLLPGLELEVAPECSSIRSSLILVVLTMFLAQLLLRSPWHKLAAIAFSIPLSFAKNGLRIFVLGWLAVHGDPKILDSPLHRQGGPVFLAIALAAICLLIWIFHRGERRRNIMREDAASVESASAPITIDL